MGEINGMVFMKAGKRLKPQSRILINIFTETGAFVVKTQSEADGYFSYIGLAPGRYYAEIDRTQLSRLKSSTESERFDFEIRPTENGDIIDNIEFVLTKEVKDVQGDLVPGQNNIEPTKPEPKKTPTLPTVEKTEKTPAQIVTPIAPQISPAKDEKPQNESKTEKLQAVVPPQASLNAEAGKIKPAKAVSPIVAIADSATTPNYSNKYYIQVGAWKNKTYAQMFADDLSAKSAKKWFIVYEQPFYKVRIGYFITKMEAARIVDSLKGTNHIFYINKMK